MLFIIFIASYAQELVQKAIADSLIEVTLLFWRNTEVNFNILEEIFLKTHCLY